jgi:predicted esterase
MKRFCLAALSVLFVLVFSPRGGQAEMFEVQVEGKPGENAVAIQLRSPFLKDLSSTRGTLVLLMGSGMHGAHLADDLRWQALAERLDLGLVVAQFLEEERATGWFEIRRGTGRLFWEAWEKLKDSSGTASQIREPIFMIGFSQGGQFAFEMALGHPDKIGGFITLKGGLHRSLTDADPVSVPGLLVIGETDAPFRRENLRQVAMQGTKRGAPWELLVDPGAGHEAIRITHLFEPYLLSLLEPEKYGAEWKKVRNDYLKAEGPLKRAVFDLSSRKPAALATLRPSDVNLGSHRWDLPSEWQKIDLNPSEGSEWDEAHFHPSSQVLELSTPILRRDGGQPLALRALPRAYPEAGSWNETVLVTFFKKGRKVMGLEELPVHHKTENDLQASPTFLLLNQRVGDRINGRLSVSTTLPELVIEKIEQDPPGILHHEVLNTTNSQTVWAVSLGVNEPVRSGRLRIRTGKPDKQEIVIRWLGLGADPKP